jgi:hypothetical protein
MTPIPEKPEEYVITGEQIETLIELYHADSRVRGILRSRPLSKELLKKENLTVGTSARGGFGVMGSSGIEIFLAGLFLGAIAVIVLLMIFHPAPIFIDCGCGAQSAMARQCFESGNLSSWQCGVFR